MASKARFLRIALVHDDQVLEERHVALGTDVTVGTAPDNTLVAPRGTAPRSVRVLEARRGEGHTLLFDAPEGRVDLGGGEASTLAELVEGGLAARTDRGFALPLPPKARGKLRVGDVTLLFQYLERDAARAAAPASEQAVARSARSAPARPGPPAAARPPKHTGARPMTLEATLTWDGTVLATRSFHPLRSITVGPLPECDLQLPGKVLEHRAFPIVGGDGGRFFVDLRNPHLAIDELVAAARAEDGSRVMRAQRFEGDRYPVTGPFRMRLTLRDGFALELRHAPALARTAGSPFDVQDPQPLLCLAGSALVHAVIMVIAFAVGQSLLSADEVKAAKVERRRELYTMLQEQKVEAQVEEERAAEDQAQPDKDTAEESEEPREAPKKAEATPERPKRDAARDRAADAGAATPEARRTKLREGVRQKTFLGVLGGEGQQGDGALPVGRETQYADAFDDVAAPYAANGGGSDALAPPGPDAGGGGDGPAYKTLSKEESGGESIATRTVKTDDKGAAEEAKVKVNVRTGSLGEEGGLGSINHQAVAGVFARRKGAIKACYEKELRRNPDLKGRITLRFTIGTSGRITNISVSQNTTGDDAIASCIIDRVQSWKFDPPSGGAVTFTYPFILEAR